LLTFRPLSLLAPKVLAHEVRTLTFSGFPDQQVTTSKAGKMPTLTARRDDFQQNSAKQLKLRCPAFFCLLLEGAASCGLFGSFFARVFSPAELVSTEVLAHEGIAETEEAAELVSTGGVITRACDRSSTLMTQRASMASRNLNPYP
jgi:hypothetical protein